MASVYYFCNLIPKYPLTYDNASFVIFVIFGFSTRLFCQHGLGVAFPPYRQWSRPSLLYWSKRRKGWSRLLVKGEKQSSRTALLAHNSDICTMLRGFRYRSAMLRPALRREVRPIFQVWGLGKQRIYNGRQDEFKGISMYARGYLPRTSFCLDLLYVAVGRFTEMLESYNLTAQAT